MTSTRHGGHAVRQRASRKRIPCETVSTPAGPADPLPAQAVARAADQARIQTPALCQGFGPAVVERAEPASTCAVARLARPTQ
jgi:hypothetical protein